MKFGIFHLVPWHESRTQEQALREAMDEIELADRLGIDEAWLGEHRFSRHGLLSGMWSFLGQVAGRTKRIRIGTSVIVLPLHNPILVAEEAAMLDVLSGGRLDLGLGAGYQRQEFQGLGADIGESRERFKEGVDVIIKAWTEERLTYHGKYTNVDDLLVVPKPLQKPHPPLFQAVQASPASVEFAASRNMQLQVLASGLSGSEGMGPQGLLRLWREKMEEFGHPHSHLDPPLYQSIYVAPTMEEAEQDPARLRGFASRIMNSTGIAGVPIGSPLDKDGNIPPGYENYAGPQGGGDPRGEAPMPRLFGTPEVVSEGLEKIRESGFNHVFGSFEFPGLPHEKALRSIEMFATQVMPNFREAPVR